MRFRHLSSPSRSSQLQRRRLVLTLIALVAAGLIALQIARNKQQAAQQTAPGGDVFGIAPVNYEFTAPASPERLPGVEDLPSASGSPRRLGDVAATTPAAAALDKTILADVRDDTLGIRRSEADAFFAVLDHVRRVPAAELIGGSRNDVLYVNLMSDSEAFRGDIVTVSGTLRRCEEFTANDDRGANRLYEAWVVTGDSSGHPYRVVATALDDGVPKRGAAQLPVTITGYFFKREGYEAQSGLQVAPTILAKTIAVDGSTYRPPLASGALPVLPGIAMAIGLIFGATLIALAWSDRRQRRLPASLPLLSSSVEEAVEQVDRRSVNEQLRELSERHRFGER